MILTRTRYDKLREAFNGLGKSPPPRPRYAPGLIDIAREVEAGFREVDIDAARQKRLREETRRAKSLRRAISAERSFYGDIRLKAAANGRG